MSLPLLKNTGDLKGKRVLLRLDLDVPVLKGAVQNAFRIESARETLTFLREGGARTLIIGHIGRDQKETLRPVFEYLKQSLPVAFAETLEDARKKMAGLSAGEFLLLQNLLVFRGGRRMVFDFQKKAAPFPTIFLNK